MLTKTTATHEVTLHNGGRPSEGNLLVATRAIKNGKLSGRTFTNRFKTEAEALAYYNAK